jgi:hypothetical protein
MFRSIKLRIVLFLVLCLWVQFGEAQTQQRGRIAQPPQTAEVAITIKEDFFAAFFESLFANNGSITYPLSKIETNKQKTETAHATKRKDPCNSVIKLEREMNGVKTAVKFQNGKITAPIAFSGDYNVSSLIGCVNFQGWADTIVNLQFDKEKQILKARVDVQSVNLNNVPQLANGLIVKMVQKKLDEKINPIEIVKTEQLSTSFPIKNNGTIRLKATEVKTEITPGAMNIRIVYQIEKV